MYFHINAISLRKLNKVGGRTCRTVGTEHAGEFVTACGAQKPLVSKACCWRILITLQGQKFYQVENCKVDFHSTTKFHQTEFFISFERECPELLVKCMIARFLGKQLNDMYVFNEFFA